MENENYKFNWKIFNIFVKPHPPALLELVFYVPVYLSSEPENSYVSASIITTQQIEYTIFFLQNGLSSCSMDVLGPSNSQNSARF